MSSVLSLALRCPKCGAKGGVRCVNLDGTPASGSHVNRTPIQPCGTYGGYQRHKREGEQACDACREANRRYQQEHRRKHPDRHAEDIAGLRVRREATRLLIERHRAEFAALMDEVRAPS